MKWRRRSGRHLASPALAQPLKVLNLWAQPT
jgi:hypothetical protein